MTFGGNTDALWQPATESLPGHQPGFPVAVHWRDIKKVDTSITVCLTVATVSSLVVGPQS